MIRQRKDGSDGEHPYNFADDHGNDGDDDDGAGNNSGAANHRGNDVNEVVVGDVAAGDVVAGGDGGGNITTNTLVQLLLLDRHNHWRIASNKLERWRHKVPLRMKKHRDVSTLLGFISTAFTVM